MEEAQRKDQLYQFAKSKQVRIEKELSSLRQVCVKQQRDLHFLHVNLDSSQDSRQKHEKAASGRSEENVDLNSYHLASPHLTSTQKSDMTQNSGRSSGEDSPLDISDLAVTKPTNRCCMNTDTSSLFWKLERSLAQSRQILTDLELSLLHTSPSCIANTNNMNKIQIALPGLRGRSCFQHRSNSEDWGSSTQQLQWKVTSLFSMVLLSVWKTHKWHEDVTLREWILSWNKTQNYAKINKAIFIAESSG